jgi:hypothetical protein
MRGRSLKHVSKTCGFGVRTWRIVQPCCELYLLERRLVESRTTIIIPLDNRVFVVRSLNRAQFPIWFSEAA